MTFKILSLDGGGTWALLEVMALENLYPGKTGLQILRHFDLAVANSGGSIVLGGLMLDMAPSEIRSFFEDQDKRQSIFHKRPFIEEVLSVFEIFPKYVAHDKRLGLAAVFGAAGTKSLQDWPASPGWPAGPGGEPTRALVMAFDYDRMREDFLRSYAVPATGATAEPIALVDAVHASTNAPVQFFDAPALVGSRRYWDGAMGGYNNPLMAGIVDAVALGADPAQITCLSLGTGTVRLLPPDQAHPSTSSWLIEPVAQRNPLADAGRAGGCITDDPPDAATYTAHIMLRNPPGAVGRIVRMSPVVQPVKKADGEWDFPDGLPKPIFEPLSKLGMDAVEQADVDLIGKLGEAWLKDQAPNQPIRMQDDLSCGVGDSSFSTAKQRWFAF